jgi:sialate O-acetylesterase
MRLMLGLLLSCLSALGQEPPMPPETPVQPQDWWPRQPAPLPFVHTLFSSHMVLQRDVAAPVWGWSTPGDAIAVTVADGQGATLARGKAVAGADGKWMTKIGPLAAGGPLVVTVKGAKRQAVLTNVMAGDVWLCSGQSNMGIPVRTAANATQEIARAHYPDIRSFTVGFLPSYVPVQTPLPATWEVCTPETVPNFSAVGYYFARELNTLRKIPIGILHSSVGATAAEVWISGDGIRKYMPYDFHAQLERLARDTGDPAGDYFRDIEAWAAAVDPESGLKRYASDPALDTAGWRDLPVPQAWEASGLTNFDGLVWFRKWVVVPDEWAGKPANLALGEINDTDVTWFNGALVGCNQQKGSWRRYTIDGGLVKAGSNLLVVAVLNTNGPGGFCSRPQQMLMTSAATPKGVGVGGIWKARPAVAMKDIALPFPKPKLGYYKTITGLYNGMIAPLTPFAIKGALWYQGAASWPFWLQYRRLLPALIADWRDRFQVGEFPFLIVSQCTVNEKQSHPTEPGYGEIRESQWRTVRKVPNTGLVVTTDLGDEPVANIHPKNKQDVGKRLALVARHLVYGETNLVYSGPEFTEMMLERKNADPDPATVSPGTPFEKTYKTRLYFKHVGGGLVFRPGNAKPNGFVVAGEDKQFVWADAEIEGDTVVVSSPDVAVPRHVRYGWAYNPITTLFNKEGLPAIPFRTDE